MNASPLDQFGQLLAKLSDGMLSREDSQLLNEVLKSHPASQEHLLDHMFVDGLLEQEFGGRLPDGVMRAWGPPKSSSRSAARSGLRVRLEPVVRHPWAALAIALACTVFAAVTYRKFVERAARYQLELVNSGFESAHPIVSDISGGLGGGGWYGDVAHVVGEHKGVVPFEGQRMVRFVKSNDEPLQMCEVNQVIDLEKVLPARGKRPVSVEAAALFNAIPTESSECSFGVTIYAYDVLPSEHPENWPLQSDPPLSFGGRQTLADDDVRSWQEVKATLQLPEQARFLVIQLSATRPDHHGEEFPGHFADQATVSLVSR